ANDLDGDGDCDLVCACAFANRLVVLQNDGSGKFPTRTPLAAGSFPLAAFTADLDGDGDLDAICSNYSSASVSPFRNDGAGNFTAWATLPTLVAASYPWAHDLDGDGDLDLSVVDEESDQLFVFLNGGTVVDTAPPIAAGVPRLVAAPNPVRAGHALRLAFEFGGANARVAIAPGAIATLFNVAGRE